MNHGQARKPAGPEPLGTRAAEATSGTLRAVEVSDPNSTRNEAVRASGFPGRTMAKDDRVPPAASRRGEDALRWSAGPSADGSGL